MRRYPYTIANLISKYLRGELTEEESIVFHQWVHGKEENSQLLEFFLNPEKVQEDMTYVTNIDVEAAWRRVKQKQKRKARSYSRYAGYAAAFVLLAISGWLFFSSIKKTTPKPSLAKQAVDEILPGGSKAQLVLSDGRRVELANERGTIEERNGTTILDKNGELNYNSRNRAASDRESLKNKLVVPMAGTYRLVLADGTKVWVNASSELTFPVQFGKTERKVSLKGEAYFEVAKDPSKPFIVEIGDSRIEVLGTHFNVNSYDDEVLTTLLEGSVKVANDRSERLLVPGQQASVKHHQIKVEEANIIKAVAWKNGEFYFKRDGMVDILEEIARWYDLEVDFSGFSTAKRYSGSISRNSKLSEVLEMLRFVSGVEVTIEGKTIRVQH